MSESKITPPLSISASDRRVILRSDAARVAIAYWNTISPFSEKDADEFAAFIVHCVNSHAELVEALESAISSLFAAADDHQCLPCMNSAKKARAALAAAKEPS